jgi:hypothetical protein
MAFSAQSLLESLSALNPTPPMAARPPTPPEPARPPEKPGAAASSGGAVSASALARQLSAAAARAAAREAALGWEGLRQYAARVLDHEIADDGYWDNKARHDAEISRSDDPELRARAQLATHFVNHKGGLNPFAGLSREQLDLIAYDDGGVFTVNERRAAWIEASRQEEAWRLSAIQHETAGQGHAGVDAGFLRALLEHYESLPRIERVQLPYPENYAALLEEKIALSG